MLLQRGPDRSGTPAFLERADAVLDSTQLGSRIVGAVTDGGPLSLRGGCHPQPERGIRVRLTRVAPDVAMLTTLSDLAATGPGASSRRDLVAGPGTGPGAPGRRWLAWPTRPRHP